ncbi:hypothetical protein TWF106_008147 [Orbilia oligospora]|uniref:Transmembrane protein n=1 Tax=Orbilia oligospora TaxID=2813651 RepID=A0A6G1MJF5_ORBOL|nr:hypothetical protein TWF679_009176 [Orbilia oligospora]KAF3216746.1 hypothetical protein TWF106_008147 [Orbilia oligospora]KAF3225975.1 hypothetical protein TWF191_005001 [Orbilia oligospora]KAF3259694.1 hypothetical protein TWF192_010549 [Orbilia oligospora]
MTTQPNSEQFSSFAITEASPAIPRIYQSKTTKTRKLTQWNPIWKFVLLISLAVIWYGLCELYQEYETKSCLDNEERRSSNECREILKKYYSDTSSGFRIPEWARSTSFFGFQLPWCITTLINIVAKFVSRPDYRGLAATTSHACLAYHIASLVVDYPRFVKDQTLEDLKTEDSDTTDTTAPSYGSLHLYGVNLNVERKTRKPKPQQQPEPEPAQQLLEPREQQEPAGPTLVPGGSKQLSRVTRLKSHKNPSQGRTEPGPRPRRHSDVSYGNTDQNLDSRSSQEGQTDASSKNKQNK